MMLVGVGVQAKEKGWKSSNAGWIKDPTGEQQRVPPCCLFRRRRRKDSCRLPHRHIVILEPMLNQPNDPEPLSVRHLPSNEPCQTLAELLKGLGFWR
jgi:hypothetical protein